jgi:hypothetical protein
VQALEPPSVALAHLSGDYYRMGLVDYLRRLFRFLDDEYGFTALRPIRENELRLTNATTLVIIRSEWEGPWVALDRAEQPRELESGALPLWVIMVIRNSPYSISRPNVPMIDKFVDYAKAIQQCASDVLLGDFSIEPLVEQFLLEKREQSRAWERQLNVSSAVAQADQAFRSNDFARVIQLLMPHQADLSRAQAAKLAYSQRQLHAT